MVTIVNAAATSNTINGITHHLSSPLLIAVSLV
jgi:hypothetical protein